MDSNPVTGPSQASGLLRAAAAAFVLAALVPLAIVGVCVAYPQAVDAFRLIGGKAVSAPVDPAWFQAALGLDFLFPCSYGAAIILLALALGKREGAETAGRFAAMAALAGTAFDFIENGMMAAGQTGAINVGLVAPVTLAKYGLLAISLALVAAIMPSEPVLARWTKPLLALVTPMLLALLVSGLGGSVVETAFPMLLAATFCLLAVVCRILRQMP